ncbi:hypothetical protein DOABOMFO_00039 [Enterococcus phage EF_KTM]
MNLKWIEDLVDVYLDLNKLPYNQRIENQNKIAKVTNGLREQLEGLYDEVGLNDTQVVFNKVFSNGWKVHVTHSLNGFGHMYDENKPYSVNVAKPSDYFLNYLTVGTPEEVKAIINEVRGHEEDL